MVGLGLGMGLSLGGGNRTQTAQSPLCTAIARKVYVTATENGHSLLLAPHIVYNGHQGEQDLDAVVVERDGEAPNKPKLDTFKVADLAGISITDQTLTPERGFNPGDPKYDGKTICVVQIV